MGGEEKVPIRIGAYGIGDKPIFSNVETISSWTNVNTSVYSYSTGGNWCYGLFEDGRKLREASDVSLTDGNWYFEGTSRVIFYKPSVGVPSEHSCQYAPSSYIMRFNKSYIEVQELSFRFAGGGIIANSGTKGINVKTVI